jgi:hypothetical protein
MVQAPDYVEALVVRCVPVFLLLLVLSACGLFGPSGPHYVVYFQERSAQLDAPARSVIAQTAKRAKADPAAPVEVSGYTDSAGSPQADVLLSQQRAQAVADALIASGVAPNRLVRTGQGQTGSNPGVASRRVEITVGGPYRRIWGPP